MQIKIILIAIFVWTGLAFGLEKQDSLFLKGHQKTWNAEQNEAYRVWEKSYFAKPSQGSIRQDAIMNGNKILTEIWNFGSISSPNNHTTDILWEGLGYGYEFGPFVGSEVIVPRGSHADAHIKRDGNGQIITNLEGDTVWAAYVISDGLKSAGAEISTLDLTTRWGWQPLITSDDGINEFLSLESSDIPMSTDADLDGDGKPDSWPDGWYNGNLRDYVWPGALGQGATNADEEAFFVMDDRDNAEFDYFPYVGDSIRRGLGLEVEARYYQWSNLEAEDAIFLIYKIKNKGNQDLEKVVFGMWGDPHIGGWSDYRDDIASFDTQLEMTFAWDGSGTSDYDPDIIPGYLGYKFLESPGLSTDGIDNDNDGMLDESWTDGIDNDNDWNEENDDVGIDGVANTGDLGEGDGLPTPGDPFDITKPGEPNFEFTDIDESDMIGLTSFGAPKFDSGIQIDDDDRIWTEFIQPGAFDTTETEGDNVFVYGSGVFPLKSIYNTDGGGASEAIKRFSIALIIGQDRADLVLNAETVQRIYNSGYQFAKPPVKPTLSVMPGDQKVTLYWDDAAEKSVDPISNEEDFEGYIIYRSLDPGFLDQQTITDVNGNNFLFEPLKTANGAKAKFDLKNEITGFSSTPYQGRGVSFYLGDDTGLKHAFVDSNQVYNGQTYFYAVVAYDHGSDELKVPPSLCSKIISYDPTTNVYRFDINTAKVIPRRRAAGFVPGHIKDQDINDGIIREEGFATGTFGLEIVDDRLQEDDNKFVIDFSVSESEPTIYNIEDTKPIDELFTSFYNTPVSLQNRPLNDSTVVVKDLGSSMIYEEGRDYELDAKAGSITVLSQDSSVDARMADATEYRVSYTYFPVYQSDAIDGQLTNPIFDGMRVAVTEAEFGVNEELTGWNTSSQTGLKIEMHQEDGYPFDPYDYEVQFFDHIVDTTLSGELRIPFKVFDVVNREYMVLASSDGGRDWTGSSNDQVIVLRGGFSSANIIWQMAFSYPDTNNMNPPANGDAYYFATDKPFANNSKYSFTTLAPSIDTQEAKKTLDDICVVPNPYVATNVIEPANQVSSNERGYRRLYFDHLPMECTIRIYTQAGELVKKLEHFSTIDDGKMFWDLLSKDNMEIAYGLYFFHVDAPGLGQTVGKFVVIK